MGHNLSILAPFPSLRFFYFLLAFFLQGKRREEENNEAEQSKPRCAGAKRSSCLVSVSKDLQAAASPSFLPSFLPFFLSFFPTLASQRR